MKNAELIHLLTAATNKSRSIRTYSGPWISGAARIPNKISTQVGRIIYLIQTIIDQGKICEKDEGLLIYNFQPVCYSNSILICTLDTLIRPLDEINNTQCKEGKPIGFYINAATGEVTNVSVGLLEMGLITHEELIEEGAEEPIIFGKYEHYPSFVCFISVSSDILLDSKALFMGEFDQSKPVQDSKWFDSYVEARDCLQLEGAEYQYICEIKYSKEDVPKIIKKGIGKKFLKIIDIKTHKIETTPIKTTFNKEDNIEDELERLTEALKEPVTTTLSLSEEEGDK